MTRVTDAERSASTLPAAEHVWISQLFARYAWGVDCGDMSAMLDLFTPDALIMDSLFGRFQGTAEIRSWLNQVWGHPIFPGRQHWVGQNDIRGSVARCTVNSFCVAADRSTTGASYPYLIAGYTDELVKVGGRWLFAERAIKFWSETTYRSPSTASDDPGGEDEKV